MCIRDSFDTIGLVNFENLKTQLEIIRIFLAKLFNIPDKDYDYYIRELKEHLMSPRWLGYRTYDWCSVKGVVAKWSKSINDYVPVPNALVTFTCIGGREIGPFIYLRRFNFTDEYGRFEFTGGNQWDAIWELSAWKVDSIGNVIYAPDFGRRAWAPLIQNFAYRVDSLGVCDIGFLVIFKAASLVFYDVMSTTSLSLVVTETGIQYPVLTVYQSDVHLPPESFSYWQYGSDVAVINIPPDIPIEVLWKFGVERPPRGILANITLERPLGYGYKLKVGETLYFPFTSLLYAEAFYSLNEERYNLLRQFISNLEKHEAYKKHVRSGELINEARKAISEYKYTKAYCLAIKAWSLGYSAYKYARRWFEDTAAAVPFFSALIIPFVIVAEKLLFNLKGFKKIFSLLGIFAVTTMAFYELHPGFHIAASPIMIIIGFTVLTLSFPILIVLIRYSSDFIRTIRVKRIGMHEISVSRLSMADRAVSIGIEFMRKRTLRTVLTLVSIIIVVASLTSIVSIEQLKVMRKVPGVGAKAYQGIYIHKQYWGAGSYEIPTILVEFIKSKYGEKNIVAPRAWKYTWYSGIPPHLYRDTNFWKGEEVGFKIIYKGKRVSVPILWGLTAEEYELGWPKPYLIHGEWFAPGSRSVMIVTEHYAHKLRLNVTEIDRGIYPSVMFEGIEFKVIGVVSDDIQEQLDLDGSEVTPIKTWSAYPMGPNPWLDDVHAESEYFIILPLEDVIALGGSISSISIKIEDASIIDNIAKELFDFFPDYAYYVNNGKEMYILYKGTIYTVWGLAYQIVPLIIVMLTLLNLMLGTVYERKDIIAIYSALGLSAAHIGFMFLAEAAAYALIGGIVGYLLAILQTRVLSMLIVMPAISYSSTWSLMAVGGAMLITIFSSLYPIVIAAKLVTPSLERAWKIPTKPKGDLWEIPLPFYTSSNLEAKGVISYIREYVEPHILRDAPGFSVSNIRVDEGIMDSQDYVMIRMETRLPPYELGVSQITEIYMLKLEPMRWGCQVVIRRKSGALEDWERLNRKFLDLIRKQLLLWRTLKPEEKDRYARLFKKVRP